MIHLIVVVSIVVTCIMGTIAVKLIMPDSPLEKEVEVISEEVIKQETGVTINLESSAPTPAPLDPPAPPAQK